MKSSQKKSLKIRIRQLEAENEVLRKVVQMTDQQIRAWTDAVIEIAEKLK
jgi:hypothetical protein